MNTCRKALSAVLTVASFACFACCADAAFADPLAANWPQPPSALEALLARDRFTITEVKGAGAGVTGASRLKVAYPDGTTLKVKWKAVPESSADGWNNSPRKELAAYAVQRVVFDESDYTVPTAVAHCIPVEEYKSIDRHPEPSFAGSTCVLGVLAVWLGDVTVPARIYDEKRFASDAVYARSLADMNVLTYLIDHRDGRHGNILLSTLDGNSRVYSVDNGIAFGPFPWNFTVPNWNRIRVPWLRRETVEKLRHVDRAALASLGVVAELERGGDGVYRVVAAGPNIDATKGVRRSGSRLQFGLTTSEIDDVFARLTTLLAKVDSGKIPLR